jgi:hypothetical protein
MFTLVAFALVLATNEPLPLDLAFGARRAHGEPRLLANGRLVAYEVQTPVEVNPTATLETEPRFMPNGVPRDVIGVRAFVCEVDGSNPRPLATAGNSWRVVPSPSGKSIAFYCDANGDPEVWVYDVSTNGSRPALRRRAKASLWTGDEPMWSADESTLFIRLAPQGDLDATTRALEETSAASKKRGVEVHRFEPGAKAEDAVAPLGDRSEFYRREHLTECVAVDLASGASRVVVASTTEPPPAVYRLSASGRFLSYLSVFRRSTGEPSETVFDLAVLPATGGEPRVIGRDLPLPDGDYFGETYRWHPQDERLAVLERGKLRLYDFAADGAAMPRTIAAELGPLGPMPLAFSRDGKSLIVGTDPIDRHDYRGASATGLAIVDLASGESRRLALQTAGFARGRRPHGLATRAIDYRGARSAGGRRFAARGDQSRRRCATSGRSRRRTRVVPWRVRRSSAHALHLSGPRDTCRDAVLEPRSLFR